MRSTPSTARRRSSRAMPGPTKSHPFPASTCISLNEQVVHGIPANRRNPRRGHHQDRHRLQAQRLVRRRRHQHPRRQRPPGTATADRNRRASPENRHGGNGQTPLVVRNRRPDAAARRAGRLQRRRAIRRPRHRPHHARKPAGAELRHARTTRNCARPISASSRAWSSPSSRWSTWAAPRRASWTINGRS